MVRNDFYPVNCPSLPALVNYPGQMPRDEFKNYFRSMKYFLIKGKLDSSSNLCSIQQCNFRKSKIKGVCLALCTDCGK